jgi:tRNA pseudouridine38-40 synthase
MPLGTINRPVLLNPDVVWRAAVKLAYDGRSFMGSQRQPGERTVESETINALRSIGAIDSTLSSRFRFASRTDRGVSALGNVVAFDTSFSSKALLRAMNSAVEDVYFYGVAEAAATFSPRRAKGRWYRYLLPAKGLDPAKVADCAAVFEGRHDFHRFCKPDGRSTMKTLDSIKVKEADGLLIIDIRGREFLRNMVRRLVASMSRVGEGKVPTAEVVEALEGRDISFGLAPPEGLTLMDIEYGFPFACECPPTMARRAEGYRLDAYSRLLFADALLERCRK